MQLINNLEKVIVKSPGRELSLAFGTSKDPGEGTLWLKVFEIWLDSLGSEILIGKKIFWSSSKVWISTTVRG